MTNEDKLDARIAALSEEDLNELAGTDWGRDCRFGSLWMMRPSQTRTALAKEVLRLREAMKKITTLEEVLFQFLAREHGACQEKGGFCQVHSFDMPCPVGEARKLLEITST